MDSYRIVTDGELLYHVDKDKKVIHNSYEILLSENSEIMKVFDEKGLGDIIRYMDRGRIEGEDVAVLEYYIVCYGLKIGYDGCTFVCTNNEYNYVINACEYLTKGYASDAWILVNSVSNEVCDSAIFYTSKGTNNEAELYVYGRDNELQEIKYVSDTREIKKNEKATFVKYLLELGLSETEAEELVSSPPTKSVKIGTFKCIVEKREGKYVLKVSK